MDAGKTPTDPITVTAFSERFEHAFAELLGIEGGFVDDPVDRGGATKYGISLRFLKAEGAIDEDLDGYADFDLDMDGDIDGADIRKLTVGDAKSLYKRSFWQVLECESFPRPIGEMLFDQGVNGGNHAAKKLLQQAINAVLRAGQYRSIPLKVDGQIGEKARRAFDSMWARHPGQLAIEYREAVKDRYVAIVRRNPSQAKFLKGWLNRAERLGR
jgi:lysozyme family protein